MHSKKFVIMLFIFGCFARPALADMLINDIDDTDLTMFSSYWDGNDTNPMDLNNNGDDAEENWLEALLGLEYNDPSINRIDKIEDENTYPVGEKTFTGFYPGFAWDYAVIKASTISYALKDTDLDNFLSWTGSSGSPQKAVSYISFYSVPEPSSTLLIGTCLVGLIGLTIRRKK